MVYLGVTIIKELLVFAIAFFNFEQEYDIASYIRDFAKVSNFTELKNFNIALSVFMVVDSQI